MDSHGRFHLGEYPDQKDEDQKSDDNADDDLHLHVFPELLPFNSDGRAVELLRPLLQALGPVLQLGQLSVPFQHFLHIFLHDVLNLVHLAAGCLEVGLGRIGRAN